MPQFLLDVHPDHGGEYPDGPGHAVVRITAGHARDILERHADFVRHKAKEPLLLRWTYSDPGCEFYPWTAERAELLDGARQFRRLRTSLRYDIDGLSRTECHRMAVDEDGVNWECLLRNADDVPAFVTAQIPVAEIRRLAGRGTA